MPGLPARLRTGKAGEAFFETWCGATTKELDTQVWFPTRGIGRGRLVDVLDKAGYAHESEVERYRPRPWSSSGS